jgi:hypothetical protein
VQVVKLAPGDESRSKDFQNRLKTVIDMLIEQV